MYITCVQICHFKDEKMHNISFQPFNNIVNVLYVGMHQGEKCANPRDHRPPVQSRHLHRPDQRQPAEL